MSQRPEERFICVVLILLAMQGCQRTYSTRDSSQSPAKTNQPASVLSPVEAGANDPAATTKRDGMVLIRGGKFVMGTDDGMPYEAPAHEVSVKSFWIDEHEVTVADFARFVAATGYKTDAEKFGWSGVFNLKKGEWERVDGANWRHPEGPKSNALPDEPVCQVSWGDAQAYAKWANKRLPTEAEWEFAARGGLVGKKYSWGDDLRPNGKPVANWWQGNFPEKNTGEDGFIGRAPVESFPPNGYGLYDMTGNVWEWCADWYADDYYRKAAGNNPAGPESGEERVIKGGSYLCAENFCTNYRVAARSHATPDSGLNNLGFRCVRDE
ncbi:MAG: formylglycine-generating enzyme family protein [Acidobacteriota bacterium]|nr:formylglycine-generating enzyme family protein [Acidobacteriota bacterium]